MARTRQDPQQRRQQIAEAALALLADDEPQRVSVTAVARRAQTSAALVHHYFGTREELTIAVLRAAADQLLELMVRDPSADVAEQLGRSLTVYLDHLTHHGAGWAALLRAGAAGQQPYVDIARQVDDRAVEIACATLVAADPAADHPWIEAAVRDWLELVKSACLRWLERQDRPREVLQAYLASTFVACVGAAAEQVAATAGQVD